MTHINQDTQRWLDKVLRHKDILSDFLANYHPRHSNHQEIPDMVVTAAGAEEICETVRRRERNKGPMDVVKAFHTALDNGNVVEIYSLLQTAWFGVPESTECWYIDGFKEAVNLLDDPPEMDMFEEDI